MSDNDEPQLQPPTILGIKDQQENNNNVADECQTRRNQCCSMRQKRMGVLFFSVLYVPLFAGAFFGFGPMQILLENNGAFSSECENNWMNMTAEDTNNDDVCPDQTAKLLTVPFVGQLMILTSPLVGALADYFGPMAAVHFQTVCEGIGLLCLLLAVSIPVDNLLYIFSICGGLMANAASILTVKTGMLFADDTAHFPTEEENGDPADEKSHSRQDQNQSRVISILNALFDAGSVTYLGLWGISKLGVSLPTIVGIYIGLAVFCLGGVSIFWYSLGEMAEAKTTSTLDEDSQLISDDGEERKAPDKNDKAVNIDTETGESLHATTNQALTPVASTTSAPSDSVPADNTDIHPAHQSSTYICVEDRPPRKQLLSLPFLMLLLFFAINLARNMFVLTTARDFIRYLSDGDKESGELYLTIFTLLMPASLIGLPFTDQVIARFGFHAGFQIVCLLGIVHGVIQISCDELNGVQIFGFLVFSFYRCFLFSIVFSYLPTLLSGNVVGKGVGALHMAGGTLAFLNIPLSNIAVKYLDGNFFVPNLIYTVLAIPCAGAAWIIGQTIQKEASAKGEKG